MSEQHIGTCSECGGRVVKHIGPWFGVNPPEARCTSCGAGERKPVFLWVAASHSVLTGSGGPAMSDIQMPILGESLFEGYKRMKAENESLEKTNKRLRAGIRLAKLKLYQADLHSDFGHLCEINGDTYTTLETALKEAGEL